MEHYIVSARKYRPAAFGEVIGQEALTTTLKNAVSSGKLAHAYLFCGPRGVGKTTCARIFAKTINCASPKSDGEACGVCESCKAFEEGRSLNVYELDAASNNSVEDIRTLCDQVQVLPQIGKYKVFIIDEVHMLSTSAFNAFLKTLEEPPAHAIFILATTEKHKILPTILSRCQIYDFNRMDVADVVNHLKHVAESEGVKYEEEALSVIARKADGGMRDALSIFDQVASFSEGNITYRKVIEDLNILDSDYYFTLTDQLLSKDITGAMLILNEILSKGFDGGLFVSGLGGHLRDLLMSSDDSTRKLVEVTDAQRQRYAEQAKRCTPKFLYRAIKICTDCEQGYRASRNKRLLVEITLIEVAQATDDEVAGRRPAKILRPIFSKEPQNVSNAAQPSAQNTERRETTPKAETVVTNTQAATAPKTTTETNTAAGFNRNALRISIKKSAADVPEQTQTEEPRLEQSSSIIEEKPFDESELSHQWLRYAMSLPKEQNAMAARLKNMKLRLTEPFIVKVLVDNEQVAEQLQSIKNELLDYLRVELHNGKITLNVSVSEETMAHRAYSKKEQFEALLQKSEHLRSLCKDLQLELAN